MPPEVVREFEERRGLRARLTAEGFPLGPVPPPPTSAIATVAGYAREYIYASGVMPQRLTAAQFARLKTIFFLTGHDALHAQLTLADLCEVTAAYLAESVRDDDRRFFAEKEKLTEAEADAALVRFQGVDFREYAARQRRAAAALRMRATVLRRPCRRTDAPALGRPRARGLRVRRRRLGGSRARARAPGREPAEPEPAALGSPPPPVRGAR